MFEKILSIFADVVRIATLQSPPHRCDRPYLENTRSSRRGERRL